MVLVGIMMPVFSKAGLGQNGTKMVPLCPQSKIMAQVAFAAVQRAIKPRELGERICGRDGGVGEGRGGELGRSVGHYFRVSWRVASRHLRG